MKLNKAIKEVTKQKNITQSKLADLLGYNGQSGIAMRLRGDMKISTAVNILNALDYEIVIQPKSTRGKRANGAYVITNEEEQK